MISFSYVILLMSFPFSLLRYSTVAAILSFTNPPQRPYVFRYSLMTFVHTVPLTVVVTNFLSQFHHSILDNTTHCYRSRLSTITMIISLTPVVFSNPSFSYLLTGPTVKTPSPRYYPLSCSTQSIQFRFSTPPESASPDRCISCIICCHSCRFVSHIGSHRH